MKSLKEVVLERTQTLDERTVLTCAVAHEIAKELEAPLGEIGKICNAEKIKIVKCELHCF